MTRLMVVVLLAGTGLAVAAADTKDAAQDELKKLQGTWVQQYRERNGEKEETPPGLRAVISGHKMSVYFGDNPRPHSEVTIRIDPTKKPKTMDTTATAGRNKGKTDHAIYELEGDTLKYCVTPGKKERPKDFTTKGSGNTLSVWKRKKK